MKKGLFIAVLLMLTGLLSLEEELGPGALSGV